METISKLENERLLLNEGCNYIAGIDEVGRGPLCGPVVCAAVILPLDDIIEGVDDSKKLSKKKREKIYEEIIKKAISYSVCRIEHDEIDRINILNATKKCMANCVEKLSVKPDAVIIDAVKLDIPYKTVSIIKGDAKSYLIGAASIVAKVTRDKIMEEYSKIYPQYGFERNSGYGTKEHITAIKEFGPCEIHRKTFIKNFLVEKEKI
ncbi:MAG: ribonuclease HII [Clostridia bacterium]|nr:ribonuclease HII [Clostridia bacterium]